MQLLSFYLQARDFDPDSLRSGLPKAVSSLEWAISEGNGRVYVHCTAGLGRAPAVAIAYMYWFCNMDVSDCSVFHLLKSFEMILCAAIIKKQRNLAKDLKTVRNSCALERKFVLFEILVHVPS